MDADGTHVQESERLSHRPRIDASLCERLPEHLVDKILSRLPIEDIFRVRAVCHRWNSLVNCPDFGLLQAREGVPSEGPWFFVVAIPDDAEEVVRIAAYDPSVNKWHWIRHTITTVLDNIDYMSTDAGLICYYDYSESIAVVINPLTKAYRRLPRAPMNIDMDSLCLVVDRATRSYRVFLIGRCKDETTLTTKRENFVLEAYHSSTDSWCRMGNLSLTLSFNKMVHPTRALHGSGCLHVFNEMSSELLVFNLDEHVWRSIQTPFISFVDSEHVVQWQDRLLIIADNDDLNDYGLRNRHYAEGICMWELDRASSSWVVVDSMPNHLYQKFHDGKGQRVRLTITSAADGSLVLLILSSYSRDSSKPRHKFQNCYPWP